MKFLILQLLVMLISYSPLGSSSPVGSWQINERHVRNVECENEVGSGDVGSGSDGGILGCDTEASLFPTPTRHVGNVECENEVGSGDVGSGSDGGIVGCDTEASLFPTPTSPTYENPRILSLKVESSITARYVSTTVVTRIKNGAPVSQDSNFWFRLSKGAFISDFFMEVNGEIYQAEVQEKEAAQKAYNEARARGQTASQVKQSQNDLRKFETNINLSPNTTASFHLTFQELLRRKNGVFQHRINLYPKEVVKNLMADVYITEPQGISFANITWEQDSTLATDFLYDALSVHYKSDSEVHALFNPSEVDQEGLSEAGLQGDLVITYDVVHDTGAGHIEVVNGYFVHHISPVNLPPTRKNVVFVIDVSGSMSGRKIEQTKAAMETIIDDVREFDRFNMIIFHHSASKWKINLVDATKENKEEAKSFVNGLVASGGTNIHEALMAAVGSLRYTELEGSGDPVLIERDWQDALSMIIILTDGQSSYGYTDPVKILNSVTEAIAGEIALFSLAFGQYADYKLLEKLSGHNQGLARKIYEDSSAPLQLQGFYEEVATPLLHHITVKYPENEVELDSLTQTNFMTYFEGTELVVAGKLKDDFSGNELSATVSANSFDISYEWGLTKEIARHEDETDQSEPVLKSGVVDDFAQRLWAYTTIKSLLEKQNIVVTLEEKNALKEKALSLALKYRFVTPLTSLIIIKPDEEKGFDDTIGEDEKPVQNTGPIHRTYSSRSGAAGDPHIVVEDPASEVRVCFDIHGPEGTVVNLIEDPALGVTVNGEMVEKDNYTSVNPNKPTPSFFGRIAIQLGEDWITISRDSVHINDDRHLEWDLYSEATINSCRVEIFKGKLVRLSCENGVVMKISRHQIPRESHDHFDFFLGEGRMFSDSVNGIIGQFQRRSLTLLEASVHHLIKYGGKKARLSLDGKELKVYEIYRPRTGTCWTTYAKDGLPMLENKYEDYILPHLYANLSPN